jgi:hypothetical protein
VFARGHVCLRDDSLCFKVSDLCAVVAERLYCVATDVTLYATEGDARSGHDPMALSAVLADEIEGGPQVRLSRIHMYDFGVVVLGLWFWSATLRTTSDCQYRAH